MKAAPEYIVNASDTYHALKKRKFDVSARAYPPSEGDDLDRHYVIVHIDGVPYEQQFHQRAPWGTGFGVSIYPGHDTEKAAQLDAIANAAIGVV
jgi:hypothetical protein